MNEAILGDSHQESAGREAEGIPPIENILGYSKKDCTRDMCIGKFVFGNCEGRLNLSPLR